MRLGRRGIRAAGAVLRPSVGARLCLGVGVALCLGAACGAPAPEAQPGAPAASEEVVTLDAAQAAELTTAPAEAAHAPRELRAMGRVLDPLPLLQAWGAFETARVAAQFAGRELARVRALAENAENASARELEAASLAASQADAALAAARAQAITIWGNADVASVAPWADGLAHATAAVARVELPPGTAAPTLRTVTVRAPGLAMPEREATLLGPAGAMDPTLQGPAFLVGLRPDPPPPGTALDAQLELEGEPEHGVYVPAGAVVWHEGAPFAFVSDAPGRFERRALTLVRPWREGYLASAGVDAGEPLVVSGAEQLLSSQLVGGAEAE